MNTVEDFENPPRQPNEYVDPSPPKVLWRISMNLQYTW
ncbi:MAG: hypothetical protein PWP08_1561 [Methanofollis sp.]|nr:hypothetical protein [Methanofollis sp.]